MSQAGKFSFNTTPGNVNFLEGNTGGPVGPDINDIIYILGTGEISVSGNALTNTLTISSSGISAWNKISADTPLVVDNGYICVGGGVLNLTLPATSSVGDIIEITLDGSSGFHIVQGAGQNIRIGNQQTSVGVGGSLTSTAQGDSLRMVCSVTDLKWNVLSSMGNPTVV